MLIERQSDLPDLQGARRLALDLETRDPRLLTHGPGDVRGDGHVAGIAMAVEDGPAIYVPIGHEADYLTRGNLGATEVARWLRDQLDRPSLEIVGTNLNYDRGWLATLGVYFRDDAKILDVQLAEPLLDENARGYSLNDLATRHLGETKDERALYEWLAAKFGGRPTRSGQAKHIWRAPAKVVHDYAVSDVRLPLRLIRLQEARIAEEGLGRVWQLEQDIAHVTFHMQQRGVPVDIAKAQALAEQLTERAQQNRQQLGQGLSVWSNKDLGHLYDRAGIEYPRTPERIGKRGTMIGGVPSFTAEWLQAQVVKGCRLSQQVLDVRKTEKVVGTFIQGFVLEAHYRGRVYSTIHQLRGDDGGTVTGRFSYSNTNLQQIPARDPELGPLIRGLYVPEEGEDWVKHDHAQIEPRLTLHYAKGSEADQIRRRYRDDPTIDCYQALLDEAPDGTTRPEIKTVWLGTLYGMGRGKLALNLGVELAEAERVLKVFHQVAPYVKRLSKDVERQAQRRGWIHTLSGRRARFPLWEPADFDLSRLCTPMDTRAEVIAWLEERGEASRQVKRAWTYKALNRLIQGGAADVMKEGMVKEWKSGVWKVLGPPLITVHDELDRSVPRTKEAREALAEARQIMTEAIELRLPLHVDEERGPSWGEVK